MKPLNRNTILPIQSRPIKVLQFGTGNFLRGFVDWVIDLMNEKTGFNGDIQVVQPHGKKPAEKFIHQDGLYHVLIRGIQQGKVIEENRLITCVRGVVNPYLEFDNFLILGENPDLRFIVSNTTEAGIFFDPNDGRREVVPNTFPGKLTALLFHRFNTFEGSRDKGLIIIPCELVENNGEKLKSIIFQYSELWNLPQTFKDWIEKNHFFCNTLVDRIVPGFPEENSSEFQELLGYKDELMVMAEPFHLWVLEGPQSLELEFPAGKIGLAVKFVNDLQPFRERKVRILNGAHTALVPVAFLKGHCAVREAVEDNEMGEFLIDTILQEIIPTLNLPKAELEDFAHEVLDRFKNPFIKHQLSAIALNSISKFRVRVLPSLLEYVYRNNSLPKNLVHSFAALIVFYRGIYKGEKTPVKDTEEVMKFFQEMWKERDPANMVSLILSNQSLWGQDLNEVPQLAEKLIYEIQGLLDSEKTP